MSDYSLLADQILRFDYGIQNHICARDGICIMCDCCGGADGGVTGEGEK